MTSTPIAEYHERKIAEAKAAKINDRNDHLEGSTRTATSILDFRCHVCGGAVSAVEDDKGGLGLVHVVPICKAFAELEVDEFMIAYRRSQGISDEDAEKIWLSKN